MFCEKCGAFINENSRVCPQCGSPVKGEEQNITATTTYQGSLGSTSPVLVWGIIGLGCSLTFYLSILGVIFSIVGLKKSNAYNQFTSYASSKKATIGRRLSIVGIIVGIVFSILFIVFIVFIANKGSYH